MNQVSTWKYVLLAVAAMVIVIVVILLQVSTQYHIPSFSPVLLTPTPTPTYLNTIHRGGAVAKTIGSTTIDYWLYGHIVSVGAEDTQGLHGQFVFQGDPISNAVPIVIINHQQIYKLLVYAQGFGQQSLLNMLNSASMKQTIIQTTSTMELRVQFSKTNVSPLDITLMNSLESVNQGDWSKLTKTTLLVDSVGVSKAP
jgi:hypothetical protein